MVTINIDEIKEKLETDISNSLFVDVREKEEFDNEHIEGFENIPLNSIPENISRLKEYDEVFVHCVSGGRSQYACLVLNQMGLENVVNIEGGIEMWKSKNYPIVG